MFQPSTPEQRPEAVPIATDRETVIKFVISGPFLNAEARTEPTRESEAELDLQSLLARIGELEHELRDERSRVDALCRALTAAEPRDAAPAAPRPEPAPEPPRDQFAAPAFTLAAAAPASVGPVAPAPAPASAPAPAPAPALAPVSVAPVVERVRTHTFPAAPEPVSPPKLHALSTAASPPPPKVRGLRRMIGALRHL